MRLSFIPVTICIYLAIGATPHIADARTKIFPPNILVIVADDLGYSDLSFRRSPNTHPKINTPNIDGLARDGVQLNQFYVMPVCSPTRAAMLTGRYPMRYGMQRGVVRPDNDSGLSKEEYLLPQALRRAGYKTLIIGKWHLGHTEDYIPTKRGFDYHYGHYKGAIDYFSHTRGGELDWYRNGTPLDEKGHTTKLQADDAIRKIKQHKKLKPMFMYLAFNAVHSPFQHPDGKTLPKAIKMMKPGKKKNRKKLAWKRTVFAAMVNDMDHHIGRVLQALKSRGMTKNTVVFFVSDNGGHKSVSNNDPFRGSKGKLYEGGVRVTAIAHWPGRTKPGRRNQLMHIVDLYPTLIKLAGAQVSEESQKQPIDGINIWPAIMRKSAVTRDEVLINVNTKQGAIRHGQWKYKTHFDADGLPKNEQLFNLRRDPGETENLVTRHPKRVRTLNLRLSAYKAGATEELFLTEDSEYGKKNKKKNKKNNKKKNEKTH